MKKALILPLVFLISACVAPPSAKAPFSMKITDFSGNSRPYFIEGEFINLHVFWDRHVDAGKPIDCAISNSFTGELIWRSVMIIPDLQPGQTQGVGSWNPPYPEGGLKPAPGSYIAVCNFNSEAKPSVSFNVVGHK